MRGDVRCWSLAVVALGLLTLLSFGTSADASVVIPLADEDLSAGADAIVLARVTRITSHVDLSGQISTYITLSPDEVLKGPLWGPELTIREVGGTVGDRTTWMSANPEFVVGEPVLVFMDQRDDGTLRTYQFYMGKFTIVTDPASGDRVAVRGVPPQVTVLPQSAETGAVPGGDIARALDDFGRFIRLHAFDVRPQTGRPRPALPFLSAVVPPTGIVEEHWEFRFIADPNPPAAVNPNTISPRWNDPDTNAPVMMRIKSTGEPAAPSLGFDQARAALRAWGRVPTASFRYIEGPVFTGTGGYASDGTSTISFRDPLGQIANPSGCSGILGVTWVSSTGAGSTMVNGRSFSRIIEADVVIADGWDNCNFYQNVSNLTEVLTHELGHGLGLGHADDITATMYAYIHFDGRGASLQVDDRAGVTFIYPGRTLTILMAGTGSGTISSGTDGISCPGDCVAGFAPNTTVNLTVIPASGSTFNGFIGAGCGTSVAMTIDRTCTATFTAGPPATFFDVPSTHPFFAWIEALAKAGITGGCSASPPQYCPDASVTRKEMAVFLLRGIHGAAYQPSSATGTMFTDVPADMLLAAWVEQLAHEGITGGCATSPPRYCPDTGVTRGQMAVFLLRAKHGAAYQPPAATGMFADVPLNHPFVGWIEQLARENVTGGCATNPARYCPDGPVTRGQMAVFLVRAFNLPM
jgi:hypothetical protein